MEGKGLFPIAMSAVVLDCPDVAALAAFYTRLLGWEQNYQEEDQWIDIAPPAGGMSLAFQKNEDYVPPVWPEEPGAQQQMVHLDFIVHGQAQMETALLHALSCGAKKADTQYGGELWTTMLDPVGHPFCFVIR